MNIVLWNILEWLLAVFIAFDVIVVYGCMVVACRCDEEDERMWEELRNSEEKLDT